MRPAPRVRRLALLSLVLALLAGCATAPTEYREPTALAANERTALNARVFERVRTLVQEKYYDATFHGVDWSAACARHRDAILAAPDDATLYRQLNELCRELKESHLAALAPRRVHEMSTAHRAAIGLRARLLEGRRVIVELVPNGPAARAGVQIGWILVSRDGQPLPAHDDFIPRVGQPISYGFLDAQDQPHTLIIEPALVDFTRRESRPLAGGARYLRFDRFDLSALNWLSTELKTHASAPAVVLDLRDNSGGMVLALNLAVSEFFPRNVAEGRWVRRNGTDRDAQSRSWRSARYTGRVVVLTSGGTGSAAELLAHVLRHHRRATLVGQKTAGAVMLSHYYNLPGGGRLQIPTEDYVGLDGQRLEGRGVTPDSLVDLTLADARAVRDPALEAALRLLAETGTAP